MGERARRIESNEVLFREVNEQTLRLDQALAGSEPARYRQFFCECGRLTCTERIDMTLEEYLHVRERDDRFAIVPGHEFPEVEDVAESTERFEVVVKRDGGPAGDAAQGG